MVPLHLRPRLGHIYPVSLSSNLLDGSRRTIIWPVEGTRAFPVRLDGISGVVLSYRSQAPRSLDPPAPDPSRSVHNQRASRAARVAGHRFPPDGSRRPV